ncbi:MAG: Kazal-type serine protease inhibitor domain-containing protein [Parvularculaceae bacterium]
MRTALAASAALGLLGCAGARTTPIANEPPALPTVCATIYEPVCGADGATYPNACSAAAEGVGVAYEGGCEE